MQPETPYSPAYPKPKVKFPSVSSQVRRERAQTHHLPQMQSTQYEDGQSLGKAGAKFTNSRNDDRAASSVASGARTHRELTNLHELRNQRKVSRSIQRAHAFHSNKSEQEGNQLQELLLDDRKVKMGAVGFKIQDLQKQLVQMNESLKFDENGRIRSNSFQRTRTALAQASAPIKMKQVTSQKQLGSRILASSQATKPIATHARVNSSNQ